MARTYSREQLDAIQTTDRTVLLSAAAGSGKTSTLTERLIRMITREKDPLDVSRMLVVTYTRAAAGELRERISDALAEAIEKDPTNKTLAKQALLLPTAKIRTIDSFCNDLVRGHTEELDISPLYRIPDDAEMEILGMGVMEDLIEEAYAGDFAPEGLDTVFLAESLVTVKTEKALVPLLLDFFKKELSHHINGTELLREEAVYLKACASLPFFATRYGELLCRQLTETLTERTAVLRALTQKAQETERPEIAAALQNNCDTVCAWATEVLSALPKGYTEAKAAMSAPIDKAEATADNELTVTGMQCKTFRADFLKLRTARLAESFCLSEEELRQVFVLTHRLALSVYLLLSEYERRFTEEKKRLRLCEYRDLELFAHRLLLDKEGKKTPLAEQLTASFDVVCIDEYQDVNKMQHEIFEAISSPTNRFMVGDIKQSIYGYRGADCTIFKNLRTNFPSLTENKNEAVLFLTRNFRSAESILSFANGVFDFLFGIVGESIDYVEEDRLRPRTYEEGEVPPTPPKPTLFLLPSKHDDAEPVSEEAFVAKQIRALLNGEKLANGKDITPSDIAVLVPTNKKKQPVYAALAEIGVPVCYEEDDPFFTRGEILLALCLCNAVSNPRKDIYLAGLLRSPLYRFTMEELIKIKRVGGETLYDALVTYTEREDFPKGKAFLAELSTFRARAKGERADRLIRYMFDKTAIFAAADREGQERLRRFYELAREKESISYHGLYRFIAYLNDLCAKGSSLGTKTAKGAGTDGVRITTIHKAKGLEYPICFLLGSSGLVGGTQGADGPMHFSPTTGFCAPMSIADGLGIMSSPLQSIWAEDSIRLSLEEDVRVLYVALTRPKERMYIAAAPAKKADGFWSDVALLHDHPSFAMLLAGRRYLNWILAALLDRPDLMTVKKLTEDPAASVIETPHAVKKETEGEKKAEGDCASLPKEEKSAEAFEEEKKAFLSLYEARFSFIYPHAAEAALPGKVSISRLYPGYLDEEAEETDEEAFRMPVAPDYLLEEKGNLAALAGTATHLFLQFCDLSRLLREDIPAALRIEGELKILTDEKHFLPKEAKELVQKEELAAFLSSDLAKELAAAKETYKEFRFNTHLPASLFAAKEESLEKYGDLSVFVQGVIDLLLVKEDGSLLLVDYKTDRLPYQARKDEREAKRFLFERHGDQLTYYAEAVARIFKKRPTIAIYSLPAAKLFFAEE